MPIYHGDNRDGNIVISAVRSHSINLILTDPPYNIGADYIQYHDSLPTDRYLNVLRTPLEMVRPFLAQGASIVVVQADKYAAETKLMLDSLFTFRQWCIWHYTFGVACTRQFARSHCHVFWYTHGNVKHTWNADAIRVPSDRQAVYNDPRANPAGKIPDDVMTFSRVCGTFDERQGTPNQLPETLCERFIRALTNVGDVVYDPFAGSGTVPCVAKRLGRVGIGIELVKPYYDIAQRRYNETQTPN